MTDIEAGLGVSAAELSETASDLFRALLKAPCIQIGLAKPPSTNGVYAFSQGGIIIYVGEAAGSSGLRDRITRKHVSGDESHALQGEFEALYPDRRLRRSYIKETINVQWVEIPDSLLVSVVEKLAIAVLKPSLNKSIQNRTLR